MIVRRFERNPIITPHMDDRMGSNINGPSLIRVPDWLPDPLGRYYLYFAHHKGQYIRLAYADDLAGPWTPYQEGTLALDQTPCRRHIASPDMHVDHDNRRIVMYYHGPADPDKAVIKPQLASRFPSPTGQRSFVATSEDGIHFTSGTEVVGNSYVRAWQWGDYIYALGGQGRFFRSQDGFHDFVPGPTLFTRDLRHLAVKLDGDVLTVFYSNAHDCPEHILASTVYLTLDWMDWTASDPVSLLKPETEYEGANLPLEPSERGWAPEPVRQLRDPCIYVEGERTYLLYSVAGESGIAIGEIVDS